ncbi:MAG: glycosyltransferase family 2 protein [Moraxella sp.]|uniref:glycosyltransferase family 2 protein n=1 Tax=Moraxella sp. TaxID=479 RepID=UPI0026DAFD8B|nr:glycosyltransferase family 2 protein [Moraxella sp.]MDO4450197.1 glycosyltransferase family 2 protein [Moraxella sp.]
MSINIDVIIPCYNTATTLVRAVESVLGQDNLGGIYLIDDGSTDDTWQVIVDLQNTYPTQIHAERLPTNKGVATARNFGAMLAKSDYVAFLDADDTYQREALQACAMVFANFEVGLIRLPMTPIDLPKRFANHPDFYTAWRTFEMTAGSNMVFYRPYFLALGGFDDDELFKKFGGEDGALGLATIDTATVATLFDNQGFDVGVNYHCHDTMYANHLFNAMLFGENVRHVSPDDVAKANQSTQNAINRVQKLRQILSAQKGKMSITLS